MEETTNLGRSPVVDACSSSKPATPILPSSNRSKRRATRACDRCKHKKMRCSGQQPCIHCTSAGVPTECSFTAKYTRGKAPKIQVSRTTHADWAPGTSWAPEAQPRKRRQSSDHSSESSSSEQVDPSPGNRDKPRVREDQETEPQNFASAYRRAQHDLYRGISKQPKNPIYAFGDPLLPVVDLSIFLLPPLEEARYLVNKFFDVVTPNMRVLHQPTVDRWLLDVIRCFRTGQHVDNARSAIVLIIFATSYNYTDMSSDEEDASISFRYFQAADDLLRKEKGEVRLESIQARLLQIFYLSSRSRVNHAWSILGTVVSQIYAMRLHRKANVDGNIKKDFIHTECVKRVFWTAYTVDKHFSLGFGRPEYFNDDMIDQELPLLVDDENLTKTSCIENRNELLCPMRSSVYQKQMAMILGAANRDLYGIRPQPMEKRLALARKHHNSLKILAHSNNAFLNQDITDLRTLFRQQLFGVKLTHTYLCIIIFRPFLLHNPSVDDEINLVLREEHENNVLECLRASMDMTEHLNDIFKTSQFFNGSWFTHFCGYTAVVALYVYVIKHQSDPEEEWMTYFKAAERCQSQIKVAAEKESISQRSSQILDELYAEAMSHILRRKRQREQTAIPERQKDNVPQDMRSQQPQYSEQFDMPIAGSSERQSLPEYTYGEDWQNMNFDQTAPGGGILGSMDWIQMQGPSSVVDQIERWGFSSLTGW